MSDDAKEPDADEVGPLGGERLRAARRANDISLRDIAKELHLDEGKVRALEQNEFDVLGAPVFAKGHLRKYAELVGVAEDDIMTDYYKMTRTTAAPPLVSPVRKRPRDINVVPWILGALIVVVVGAAAYWWFVQRTPEPASSRVATPPAVPASREVERPSAAEETGAIEIVGADTEADAAVPAEDEPEEPMTSNENASVEAQPVAVEAPLPESQEVSVDAAGIRLSFSGDCWTEVSDATGERLFYDLGAAGRVVSLSGEPPFRVILGDAENVSISVNGQEYPIPESARRGRLARLTINPD